MKDKIAGSFRDPSGFLFTTNNSLYRQINLSYKNDYDLLINSGLYDHLMKSRTLVSHEEVDVNISPDPQNAYKVIKPDYIDFISYPYEWCFSQLQEAAILTLAIAKRALEYGMSLKDASAYNIQFVNGSAIFIDSLSFEEYQEELPWVAYRQFCQHFLAPLSLMVYRDIRMNQLLRTNIDGIPLDVASKLLPFRTRVNLGLLTHIHLHAKSQKRFADKSFNVRSTDSKVSKQAIINLIDNLSSTVRKLKFNRISSEWDDYYLETNYSKSAFREKEEIIESYISYCQPNTLWDLGANNGVFSRIASNQGIKTVAFDVDPGAIEQNYAIMKTNKEKNILPLLMDLTNPSPSIGWHHQERLSLIDRSPVDLVMALALIHHLSISNNVPLKDVAKFLKDLSNFLIIEFIPKSDSQVQRLLLTRKDIFPNYNQLGFEKAFITYFNILEKNSISDSERILYLLKKKEMEEPGN